MLKKKTVNLTVPAELLAEFDEVCRHYGHGKQKGMVLSAAILMFLKADPVEQGECLKEVATAQITSGVQAMIHRCRLEQSQGISKTPQGHARPDEAVQPQPSSLAAKEAGDAIHVITKLPTLDDLEDSAQKP